MKELRYIVEFLYSSFLLRDLAGKVVPGAVILFTTVTTLNGLSYIDLLKSKLQFLVWVLLLTFCWTIGLVAQAIGSRIGIVHYSFKYSPTDKFHKALRKFCDSSKNDKDDQRLERFMAIREAYGNGAAATLVAFILWLFLYMIKENKLGLPDNFWIAFVIAIASFISLLLGHRETVKHQDEFLSETIENEKDGESS